MLLPEVLVHHHHAYHAEHHLRSSDGKVKRDIVCSVAAQIMSFMAICALVAMGRYRMGICILIQTKIYLLHLLWPTARVRISRSLRGLPLISLPCRPVLSSTVRGCKYVVVGRLRIGRAVRYRMQTTDARPFSRLPRSELRLFQLSLDRRRHLAQTYSWVAGRLTLSSGQSARYPRWMCYRTMC